MPTMPVLPTSVYKKVAHLWPKMVFLMLSLQQVNLLRWSSSLNSATLSDLKLEVETDLFGSGVMSGTAVDLDFFQKLGFGDPNM